MKQRGGICPLRAAVNEWEANTSYLRHTLVPWVNYLGVTPSVLDKSKGWKDRGISGWFRTCFRAMTSWLCIMFLYIESTRMALRSSSFAHIWGRCLKFSPSAYFHTHQTANLQSLSTQQSPTSVFDYTAKKRFGLPPANAHNFHWKSPNILRWNLMLRCLVQCADLSAYSPRVKQLMSLQVLLYRVKTKYLAFDTTFWYLLQAVTWHWFFESWRAVVFTSIGIGTFSLRNLILIYRRHAGFD